MTAPSDESLTEKVETRAGWQLPSHEEDWMRGDPQELEDFVAAIEVIHAGYRSAETGRRVDPAR